MKPYEKLARYWRETDAGVVTAPTPEAEIVALEARYNVRLPTDFRDYLRFICPASERDALDNEVTDWWPLARIKNIPDEYRHPVKNAELRGREHQFLFFADGYIWCWAWAINCGDDDRRDQVVVIGLDDDRFVAPSFDDFIELYIGGKVLA